MKLVYIKLEIADDSTFDPADDSHVDALLDDMMMIEDKVRSATVFVSLDDLVAEEADQTNGG